jgi:hypothetical protein
MNKSRKTVVAVHSSMCVIMGKCFMIMSVGMIFFYNQPHTSKQGSNQREGYTCCCRFADVEVGVID